MRRIFVVLCVLSCWSCANVVSPTGGAKDVTPPQLKKSIPPLRTIYFDQGGFELEFDEIVNLENIYGQLIVSPPMKGSPEVKYHKRKVTVAFDKDDLLDSTTYTFNFGNAIVDYNEKNQLKNFTYVFSTGSYIDSLSVSGKIIDAYTKEPIENMVVLMYRSLEDSMPLTSLPNYFDISDENGLYTIGNIKEGRYKIFALEDMNQNYLYDLPAERIGFLNDFIDLDSSIVGVDMNIFNEENELQYVLSRKVEPYGKLNYTFNKPFKNLEINLVDEVFEKDEYLTEITEGKDSLNIWFPDYEDSFLLILKDDTSFIDTTNMEVIPIFSMENPPILTISSNLKGDVDLNKSLDLQFNNPITKWKFSFVTLFEDSLEVEIEPYFLDSLHLKLRIPYKWKEGKKYYLVAGLGSFTDFYYSGNDIYELKFGSQEESFYGKIKLNINVGEMKPPFIVQLLDKEKKVIQEEFIEESKLLIYSYLRPEEYGFRLIQDLNGNGKWDTGKYDEMIQPEPVVYFPNLAKVRSNWDVELSWEIELIE